MNILAFDKKRNKVKLRKNDLWYFFLERLKVKVDLWTLRSWSVTYWTPRVWFYWHTIIDKFHLQFSTANTHVHADHVTGTGEIKKRLPKCYSIIAEASGASADVRVKDGDLIRFGNYSLQARSTPGHTNGIVQNDCFSFYSLMY